MATNYDNSSIDMQIGAGRIRKRPASMLGSDGLDGARHGFEEMYGNSLDEASSGFGTKLDVTYHKDKSISIRDYGRGVPLGWNDKPHIQNWNWHQIYNELYSGGKYDTSQAELAKVTNWETFNPQSIPYLFSVGLNGLGAAATQYTSAFFEVRSYRGGICTKRSFEHGMPLVNGQPFNMFDKTLTLDQIKAIPEETEPTTETDGTYIHWLPDEAVFNGQIDLGADWLMGICRDIAGTSGVSVTFTNESTGTTVEYPSITVSEYLKSTYGENITEPVTRHKLYHTIINKIMEHEDGSKTTTAIALCDIDISLAFTSNNTTGEIACFHNCVRKRIGVQFDAIRTAIDEWLRPIVQSRGAKLKPSDYDSVVCYVHSKSNISSNRGQTKDGIDDAFVYDGIRETLADMLRTEFAKGNEDLVSFVERVVESAQTRALLVDYEKTVKQVNKVQRQKEPEKFVSCVAYEKKQYNKCELWITEGDSAKGGVKKARDKEFQAILPIRGKSLNVLKKSLKRILSNKEITDIFTLLGTGMDISIKGQPSLFDISKLKFDKIIFATDADEDGYQIRVLLFLIFYKLAPQLITEGHVFIAETPRFMLRMKDGSKLYAKDDKERDALMKQHAGKIQGISRFKGLGEVTPEVLRETTVAPATRNLVPVSFEPNNEFEREFIDALFGKDVNNMRKRMLSELLGVSAEMIEDTGIVFDMEDTSDTEADTTGEGEDE